MKASLQLRLGQQLAMTPQLRQAIRLLQLSALELQAEVQQALTSNVMLLPDDGSAAGDSTESSPDTEHESGKEHEATPDAGDFDSGDWGNDTQRADPWSGSDWDPMENQPGDGESLQDHLLWQLGLSDISGKQRLMAEAIIDGLDESGYLQESLESLADTAAVSMSIAESVLQRVQAMDPPGIAARDLRECLLAQLRLMATDDITALARQIVDEHLEDIAGSRAALAKRVNAPVGQVDAAVELIQSLDPRPGRSVDNTRPDYLVPDVLLLEREDGWSVELNNHIVPRLRLNEEYVRLLRQASSRNEDMQSQLQEARWLIRSLSIRNDTLLRVAETIVERQKDYFDHGEEAMKPLILKEVAEAVDLHESTVSRVTANKYLHTPRGTLPLKFFFSTGLTGSDGIDTSAIAVRAMIRKLIDQENPVRPLSDQKIAARLDDKGIRVARRTVTKYRESMRIPASYARKSLS